MREKFFDFLKILLINFLKKLFSKVKVEIILVQNSRKHIKLKNLIDNFINNNDSKVFKNNNKKKISFFIGSTASIIECLEEEIFPAIHICSDGNLGSLLHPRFWKPLSVQKT